MGCHTWFYEKLNPQPTDEQVTASVIADFEDLKKFLIANPDEGNHKVIDRVLRIIKKGLCKRAVYKRYLDPSKSITEYIPGKGFYATHDGLPHDLFRISDYPEDVLYSFQETADFIEKNKSKIQIQDGRSFELLQFWNFHPEGMIRFG